MKIWILNHYATGMYLEGSGRHHWFAKYLMKKGYDVKIFCSNRVHNSEISLPLKHKLYSEELGPDNVPYVFVKTRAYLGSGFSRVGNMIDFFRNVQKTLKIYKAKEGTPQVLLASSVHPLTLLAGIRIAKKFNISCICEVRDLWPETLVQYGRLKKESVFAKLLYFGEKMIYIKANALIFTMEGGVDYIKEKGWERNVPESKIFHINNGIDLDEFDINCKKFILDNQNLDNRKKYKIIYTGAINPVNNLNIIVNVARQLKIYTDIVFLIWGNGIELDILKKRVEELKLNNIIFEGRVEKRYIPGILVRGDLNLVHWEMSELLKYGCSYNKLFEYLAAGRPILSTIQTGKYDLLKKYQCGKEVENCTVDGIVKEILKMKGMSDDSKQQQGENARKAAADYDFEELTEMLENVVEYAERKVQ